MKDTLVTEFLPFRCSCSLCQGKQAAESVRNNRVANSSDYQIAALDSTARWGNPTTLTYSFFETGSSYYGFESVSEVSEAIKNNVRYILENIYEPLINVNFVEVADSTNNYGQLRFMFSNGPGYAYAYYPNDFSPVAGDVHLTPSYEGNANNAFSSNPGSYGYETLIHEIGHAMGLKHPGDYNGGGTGDPPFLPYDEDNNTNTVMTYNYVGTGGGSLMPYDIKTLQYIYGASSRNPENTTYNFTSTHGYTANGQTWGSTTTQQKLAIYDSNGIDVLNFSRLAFNSNGYRIDLRANGIITPQNEYNATSYQATGDDSGTSYYTSAYGTAIAFNTVLENVVNSSSNDYIIANSVANTFSGYTPALNTGNDIIEGSNNLDSLNLSAFSSVTQNQSGNNLVLSLGSGKSVTIKDYYTQAVNQRLQIQLGSISTPTLSIANAATVVEGVNTQSVFRVTLSSVATNPVTFFYQTSDISATATSDYTTTSGTVTINPGQRTANINVPIIDNNLSEPNENFQVTLSNPQNATISQATATASIRDTLTASVTTTLSTRVENLTLTGTTNINGTGNSNSNSIAGNSGNNILNGGLGNDTLTGNAGNDTLIGSAGSDTISGGAGIDRFSFTNKSEAVDTIRDFSTDETIQIKASGFGGSLPLGILNSNRFVNGSAALDSGDRFIYRQSNGSLFFDIDGTGVTPQVLIATISNRFALSANNIVVV